MKKEIRIYMDNYHDPHKISSYYDVLQCMHHLFEPINTYCLDFFNFDVLDKDYDVVIYRTDFKALYKKDQYYELIRLSELLDHEKRQQYTDKEIRKSHNVLKMFKAGAFKLKGE